MTANVDGDGSTDVDELLDSIPLLYPEIYSDYLNPESTSDIVCWSKEKKEGTDVHFTLFEVINQYLDHNLKGGGGTSTNENEMIDDLQEYSRYVETLGSEPSNDFKKIFFNVELVRGLIRFVLLEIKKKALKHPKTYKSHINDLIDSIRSRLSEKNDYTNIITKQVSSLMKMYNFDIYFELLKIFFDEFWIDDLYNNESKKGELIESFNNVFKDIVRYIEAMNSGGVDQ